MSETNIKKAAFTPLFQNVLDEHGITTAAVFGRVWQYCQMKRGYCHAEQETIAYHLGISRKTVNLALGVLVLNGYLSDVTLNKRGRTRIYKDTGKAGGKIYEDVTLLETEPVIEVVIQSITKPETKGDTNIHKKEKKNNTTTTQNEVVDVDDFINSLDEIQQKAYHLARQVTNHEIALSKAMSETPMESAISLLEWHLENSTPNSRVAQALLDKIHKEERREESIKNYKDNLEDVQRRFVKEVNNWYSDISNDEMNSLWAAYIKLCNPFYEDKDNYDMFADGEYNREGADDKSHYERIQEFLKRRAAQDDAEQDNSRKSAQM